MQMSVIAQAPPPHTVWRHKVMPGYFYMLMMKRKRTDEASFLPRHSCDIDPRWLPSFSPVSLLMLICWSVSQKLFRMTRQTEGLEWDDMLALAYTSLWRSSLLCVARCKLKSEQQENTGAQFSRWLISVVRMWIIELSLYFHFNFDSVLKAECSLLWCFWAARPWDNSSTAAILLACKLMGHQQSHLLEWLFSFFYIMWNLLNHS